jgi:hypothetical protein
MSIILPIKLLFYYFDVLGGFGVANSFAALGHQAQLQGVMVVRAWLTLNHHDMLHHAAPLRKKNNVNLLDFGANQYIYIVHINIK